MTEKQFDTVVLFIQFALLYGLLQLIGIVFHALGAI